jgi:hypothetical protein
MLRTLRSAGLAAITAASLLAGASTALAAEVDPSALTPPPPAGARCHTTGPDRVICDTVLNASFENAPDFEAPCGVLYVSGTDFRDGFRFYEGGLMVRRHVTAALNATWSLSPTGEGPSVRVIARGSWWSVWPVPGGDDDDAVVTTTGLDIKVIGPGLGADFQIAGRFDPDGNHSGILTAFSDESIAALCDALGG